MVDDEPGPPGDLVKCYVTTFQKDQFFFLQKVSDAIHSSHKLGKKTPGGELQLLQEDIFIYGYIGEMLLEYQKGG